jgi:hypothetical protein
MFSRGDWDGLVSLESKDSAASDHGRHPGVLINSRLTGLRLSSSADAEKFADALRRFETRAGQHHDC